MATYFIYIYGKLDMHPMGLEPMTAPSTLNFQEKETPFEVELISFYKN